MILRQSVQLLLQTQVVASIFCSIQHCKFITYCVYFYCNIEIFGMFEKRESETENEQCVIKVYALHLRLKSSYDGGKKLLADG